MNLPEIEIEPNESLDSASSRVARAFQAQGQRLFEFEHLNTEHPTASLCRFFQARLLDRECVVIVVSRDWNDDLVIAILNVLLHIRTDPDPPGLPPFFRFFTAHPAPAVLRGLFGDSSASDFECRAALVAKFGSEISPADALQLGAVAIHLLRECFGIHSDFFDSDSDLRIAQAVAECFGPDSFPEDASPLNTLITLGFLYGEVLRARASRPSRWAQIKNLGPWPVLIFNPEPGSETRLTAASDSLGVPQVVFKPIHSIMNVYQARSRTLLREARESLEATCREKLTPIG